MDNDFFWIPQIGDYAINREGVVKNRLGQDVKVYHSFKGAWVEIRKRRFYIEQLLNATFEMWFPMEPAEFERSRHHEKVKAVEFERHDDDDDDDDYDDILPENKKKLRRCHKCGGYSKGQYWCPKCRPFNINTSTGYED